jgi:hypothetical protein
MSYLINPAEPEGADAMEPSELSKTSADLSVTVSLPSNDAGPMAWKAMKPASVAAVIATSSLSPVLHCLLTCTQASNAPWRHRGRDRLFSVFLT